MPTAAVRSYADIKGWFFEDDRLVFDAILNAQESPGTLVKLGSYLGRSAVVVGDHLRPGERIVVIDLFGSEAGLTETAEDAANRAENRYSYATLTRVEFESNYLALHTELPEVIQAPSSEIVQHVAPGAARFVHIDASHLYDQVAEDIRNTHAMLGLDGVAVFDDYINPSTPGVSCAVWEAVANQGLVPFAVTRYKLYGTWGDPAKYLEAVRGLAGRHDRVRCAEQLVKGRPLLRVGVRQQPATAPTPTAPPAAPAAKASVPAAEWLPPAVARWLRAHRPRRR